MNIERRFTHVRASQGDEGSLMGRAAGYGCMSQDLGGFREIIAPGTFARALREKQDVKCLFNHNPDMVLGRTKSGTLALADKADGLHFRCDVPMDTAHGRSVHSMVKRGDVNECSFGFMVKRDTWHESTRDLVNEFGQLGDEFEGVPIRCLRDCDLQDVSVVTYPAYSDGATIAQARSLFPDGMSAELRSSIAKFCKISPTQVDEIAQHISAIRLF
jgi:HK97 family phage prohead protease